MSDKTKPSPDRRQVSPLQVETYFDQVDQAAGSSLMPPVPHHGVNLRNRQPRPGTGPPLAILRRPAMGSDEVMGHIVDAPGGGSVITNRPGDPWGFGSVN